MSMMKLLDEEEVNTIIKQCGNFKVLHFTITKYSNTLLGYLGDHLKLTVTVEDNEKREYKFFVKSMPGDQWLAEFLNESNFFRKEFVMLSDLFVEFDRYGGTQWRPKTFLIKKDLFVFEDLKDLGYQILPQGGIQDYEELKAVIKTLAKFHAQSFIYEEIKSRELKRPYRIWDHFSEHLKEGKDLSWRNTGRNTIVDFLKVNSKRKSDTNFSNKVEELIISLFDDALELTKPSLKYRNTIVHRDLWCNNVMVKSDRQNRHALILDFQTVLYSTPTLDLSSLIYFNTLRAFRDRYLDDILNDYYEMLSKEVEDKADVNFSTIFDKSDFLTSYEESVVFGITQAAIVVPIIALTTQKRGELFRNAEAINVNNNGSRSKEILGVANEDPVYRARITELFEEILDKYY